jgi:large subunit ribosomal protein L25
MPDDDLTLTAEPRTETGSRPAGRLRRQGKVPAVVYGLDTETVNVTVPGRQLAHILAGEAGANALITLKLDGDEALTLARQIQRHPTRGDLVHVDFIRIRRDVAVEAEIPVHLEGEAAGVRDGGVVEQLLFTLSIEAKPADIPNALTVDISALEINDKILVEELRVPHGVALQHEADELVVQVIPPRVEEEPEPEEAEEGELVEGEEAPEGEAPAEGEGAPAAEGGEAPSGEGGGGESEG